MSIFRRASAALSRGRSESKIETDKSKDPPAVAVAKEAAPPAAAAPAPAAAAAPATAPAAAPAANAGNHAATAAKDHNAVGPAGSGELLDDSAATPPSVFISFHPSDKSFVESLHAELSKNNRFVFADLDLKLDVRISFENIDRTDAFLFVITPESVKHPACMNEIDHAVQMGKRIIPTVAGDVDHSQVRPDLANLQWIFFPPKTEEVFNEQAQEEFADGVRLVLKALDHDAQHVRTHTKLLIRALQYEGSDFDESLLLYARDRQRAQQWMYDAAMGKMPKPTPLHMSFIIDSLGIYTGISLDPNDAKSATPLYEDNELSSVYIGYARPDKPFSNRLVSKFCANVGQKRLIWVDWEPVPEPVSPVWLKNVHRGIEAADTFLCVLSASAIKSEVWHWEVDHAMKCGKRILILVHEDVDFRELRRDLLDRSSQWLFFRDGKDDFDAAFNLLVATMDVELSHLHYHTRLLNLAVSWDEKGRERALLLSPDETQRAQDWLLYCAMGKEPRPSSLILAYLQASQQAMEKCTIL